MIVTEEEAKTKWCPEVRYLATLRGLETARCIGSACMAWQWMPRIYTDARSNATVCQGDDVIPTGYCGKAGKP